MALFESSADTVRKNAAKQADKQSAEFNKYGLFELTNPNDIATAKNIIRGLAGSNISEVGLKIGMTDPRYMLPIMYQRAIIEQNFLIIRMLNRLINK